MKYDFQKKIAEGLFLFESVKRNTTGENIITCIDNLIIMHKIKSTELRSDGAKVKRGKLEDAVAKIQNISHNDNSNHCLLRKYA